MPFKRSIAAFVGLTAFLGAFVPSTPLSGAVAASQEGLTSDSRLKPMPVMSKKDEKRGVKSNITEKEGYTQIDGKTLLTPSAETVWFGLVETSTPTFSGDRAIIWLHKDDDGGQTLKIQFQNGTIANLAND